jgi:hypothetical protein
MEHTAVLQSSSGKKKMHAPLMNQSPGHGYWIGIGMPAGPFPWPTRACMHLTAGSVVQVQRGVLRSRATSMPRRSPAACRLWHVPLPPLHSHRDVTTSRRGSRRMCPPGIPPSSRWPFAPPPPHPWHSGELSFDSPPPSCSPYRHPYLLPLSSFTSCSGSRSLLTGNHRNSNDQR